MLRGVKQAGGKAASIDDYRNKDCQRDNHYSCSRFLVIHQLVQEVGPFPFMTLKFTFSYCNSSFYFCDVLDFFNEIRSVWKIVSVSADMDIVFYRDCQVVNNIIFRLVNPLKHT